MPSSWLHAGAPPLHCDNLGTVTALGMPRACVEMPRIWCRLRCSYIYLPQGQVYSVLLPSRAGQTWLTCHRGDGGLLPAAMA